MSQIIELSINPDIQHFITMQDSYLDEFNNDFIDPHSKTYTDTITENENFIKESMPNKILFSLEETATLLGVSYDYVRNQANLGHIASKKFGKRKMIHLKELCRIICEGVN